MSDDRAVELKKIDQVTAVVGPPRNWMDLGESVADDGGDDLPVDRRILRGEHGETARCRRKRSSGSGAVEGGAIDRGPRLPVC